MNQLEHFRPCGQIAVPPTAKLIYLALRKASNDRDFIVIPQRRIAETLGINRKTVSVNLRRLERAGVITIEPLYSQYGGRLPNRYRLRVDQHG